MANNPDGSQTETFHEVPDSQYIFISGYRIAIHKAFFKWYTLTVITFTLAATLIGVYTDWWQQLFIRTLTLIYVQHPIFGVPATLTTIAVVYLLYRRRRKRLLRERQAQLHRRKFEEATIKLAEGGETTN